VCENVCLFVPLGVATASVLFPIVGCATATAEIIVKIKKRQSLDEEKILGFLYIARGLVNLFSPSLKNKYRFNYEIKVFLFRSIRFLKELNLLIPIGYGFVKKAFELTQPKADLQLILFVSNF
tara:strand:- start:100 stop:468 length:369 start_codon:yes stop_codon:yes gene_type:complete